MDTNSQRSALGLFGSLILIGGLFTPLFSVPLIGAAVTYMQMGRECYVILALALASLVGTLLRLHVLLGATGVLSLVVILARLVSQIAMMQVKNDLEPTIASAPLLEKWSTLAMNGAPLQWGWGLLLLGSILLTLTASIKDQSAESLKTSSPPKDPANPSPPAQNS